MSFTCAMACPAGARSASATRSKRKNASHSISFHSLDLGLGSGSKLTFAAKDTDFERFLAGSCAGSEYESETSSEPVDPARTRRSKSLSFKIGDELIFPLVTRSPLDGNLSIIMSFCNPSSLVVKVCWCQEGMCPGWGQDAAEYASYRYARNALLLSGAASPLLRLPPHVTPKADDENQPNMRHNWQAKKNFKQVWFGKVR